MNLEPKSKTLGCRLAQILAASTLTLGPAALGAEAPAAGWLDHTISPGVNPILFEDARISSEARPLFIEHYLPASFPTANLGNVPLGGDVQVYALQLRFALSDRLALIATKDGYIDFNPEHTLAKTHGWADLAAGLKYALVDDREHQLLLTPGFTLAVPTGSTDVMQGRGSGEWNLFVSAEKGIDDLHVAANVGFRIPNNFDTQTAQLHYSLQLDYYVHQYFIPFVAINGYTILSDGNRKLLGVADLNAEMYDLINYGATAAEGTTQLTFGGGVRSRLRSNLDIGAAYELGIVNPKGIFDGRITADLIWRF